MRTACAWPGFQIVALETLLKKAGLWEADKNAGGYPPTGEAPWVGIAEAADRSHQGPEYRRLYGENKLNRARTTAFVHSADIRVPA